MEGAYFGGARLERADFRGADLEGAGMGMTAEQGWLMDAAFVGAAHLARTLVPLRWCISECASAQVAE